MAPSEPKRGLLERHRDHKAKHDRDKQQAADAAKLSAWTAVDAELAGLIEQVESFHGQAGGDLAGFLPKTGESVYLVGSGAALIEPRRPPAHWQSGSQGLSFRVAKGVRYRVGQTKGHIVQEEERPTPVDTGTMVITDQRVVFQGTKAAREWAYSKLLGVSHDPDLPWTALQVSNRQKVSGVLYDEAHADDIRFRLQLALATFREERPELLAHLQEERRSLSLRRPVPQDT